MLFRFICKAEHSINFRALNIVSDHKSWLHLRTHTHTHSKQTHTHTASVHLLQREGVRCTPGASERFDSDKCTLLYHVAESWDASRALQKQQKPTPTARKTTTAGRTAKNTKANPCNNKYAPQVIL